MCVYMTDSHFGGQRADTPECGEESVGSWSKGASEGSAEGEACILVLAFLAKDD